MQSLLVVRGIKINFIAHPQQMCITLLSSEMLHSSMPRARQWYQCLNQMAQFTLLAKMSIFSGDMASFRYTGISQHFTTCHLSGTTEPAQEWGSYLNHCMGLGASVWPLRIDHVAESYVLSSTPFKGRFSPYGISSKRKTLCQRNNLSKCAFMSVIGEQDNMGNL